MNQTDISIIRSVNINDTDTNGGRCDLASVIVSGVKFNLFPRVTSAERESGITRYRKAYLANKNVNGETAYSACVGIGMPGNGQDRFYIASADHEDTQADVPSEWTGCGRLSLDAAAGLYSGNLPSGQTTAQYSPANPKTGKPYFTIPAECWSGVFEAGNSVTLVTLPSAKGFWLKEVVPAGCPHEPDNRITLDWQIC